MSAHVEFCGEVHPVPESGALTIGREADVVVDENPYLHRRLLELSYADGLLWLANVGSATTATISDQAGLAQSWLAPGARLPVVFARTVVWFTAGPTTYELDIVLERPPFVTTTEPHTGAGDSTIGRVSFTPDQRLLLVVLAEDVLRRDNRRAAIIPPSAVAAARLGWTTTKFNRKLDNVCEKLSRLGVRGLVGDGMRAASNRRTRLVEYALAARLVVAEDLELLDALRVPATGST